MKYSLDTIIFDFDGVLVDTGPDVASAANYTLSTLGLAELPPLTVASYIGGGAEVLLRRCLGQHANDLLQQSLPLFLQRYEECCCIDTRLYPGVKEVLAEFQKTGKIQTIATQKMERITRKILDGLEISAYFDVLIGPESVTHRKPHPESILRVLEHTHTPSTRAMIIGDAASDIQAGKAAEVWTCGVHYGYGTAEEIDATMPDLILDKLIQLLDWVE